MSKKNLTAWIWLLIVSGVLTVIAIFWPELIVVGVFLFVIPGLILLVSPSVFFYSISLTGLILLLRPVGDIRWRVAPVVLLFAAFFTPYLGNIRTYEKLQEFTDYDIDGTIPVSLMGTVALVRSSFSYYHRDGDHYCNSLCQRLLYDGVAEKVLIGNYKTNGDSDFRNTAGIAHFPATAYFIEKRSVCTPALEVLSTVSQRIASGECLVSAEATLAEAETLYISEEITLPRGFALRARYNIRVAAVNATRRSVIEKADNGYETLYQKTQTTAEPLRYPLLLSGIWHGGGNLGVSIGFLRERVVRNDLQRFEREDELRIFGVMFDAVQVPADEAGANARAIVLKALRSKALEPQAGHDFFKHYLALFSRRNLDYALSPNLTPTKEDVEIVLMALKDTRVTTGFRGLWSFNRKLESIPDELVEAMANRILKTPDEQDVVRALSREIGSLPNGQAAIVAGQILKMLQQEKLMSPAWGAIARLGDGDPRAAQHYISALQTWRNSEAFKPWKRTDETPKGPLVGLCRLGEEAREVKDDLLLLFKNANYSLLTWHFVRALLRMGAEEDLRREYEQTERWSRIASTVAVKERVGKLSKEFCDP